ncbi:MAG: hypothetical protein WB444_10155 [Gallionella sp.]
MMTAEDCRRMVARWLGKAEAASDPKTIASIRRASGAWTALAQQIEQTGFPRPQSPAPVRLPADLAKPRNIYHVDSVQVGDVLRERLYRSDETSEGSTE